MMKTLLKILILPSVFFFSSSALAANKCETFKKNALKAKSLYKYNKKKAIKLKSKVVALKKDKKKIPSKVKTTHYLINRQISKLSDGKRKRLAQSLKYLEKHLMYKKAAIKTCKHRVKIKKKKKGSPLKNHNIPTIAVEMRPILFTIADK
ncbi:MAG: hypothetical protein AAF203_10280 [Pseudomonadota bacterium]